MGQFEIGPVLSAALHDVAELIQRRRNSANNGSPDPERARESVVSLERRLRWLLLENPVATEGAPLGYCLRDSAGVMRGLTLCFPTAFLSGEQRILGLGSGSFYVEPEARSLGFYLFKKYLSSPGYSFCFATTCNAISSELWKSLGGQAVPDSQTEYMLPLRLDRMLPALVAGKTSNAAASGMARLCGRCANPMLRLLTRPAAGLTVAPCQDWERLAELSRRHRPADQVTIERSVEFLQWRYGQGSPLHPCDIYLFRDQQGNEGWFSMGNLIRGGQGQVRGSFLLDAVWPREKMSFRGIFQEIVRLASAGADAVVFRSQPGVNYREYSRLVIPHRLEAPRVFVKMQKGAPLLPLDLLDCDDSDYVAWRYRWTGELVLTSLQPVGV